MCGFASGITQYGAHLGQRRDLLNSVTAITEIPVGRQADARDHWCSPCPTPTPLITGTGSRPLFGSSPEQRFDASSTGNREDRRSCGEIRCELRDPSVRGVPKA